MEEEFNVLLGKYGIVNIHKHLQKRMKEDYDYLKKIFEKDTKKEVKETKKEKEEIEEKKEIVELEEKDGEEVIPIPISPTKFRDPKEVKAWQREQEEKKKLENEAKGINGKDLLTKENLQKWYVDEGKPFAYIAREFIGCKDSEVASAAKLLHIEASRKNIMIHAKK